MYFHTTSNIPNPPRLLREQNLTLFHLITICLLIIRKEIGMLTYPYLASQPLLKFWLLFSISRHVSRFMTVR